METADTQTIQEPGLKLADDDAVQLLIEHLGLQWNRLSPYAERLAAYAPGSGSAQVRLADYPLLAEIGAILASPDVRVSYRTGDARSAFAGYCRRDRGEQVVVVFPSEESTHLVYRFETVSEYLAWWVHAVSGADDTAADDQSDFAAPLPALTYWLHALDMYRRAFYQRLQSYGAPRQESVTVAQFAEAMEQSVASHDPHWLLPAFLLLTPGLDAQQLVPQPVHLKLLAERGFLVPAQDPRNAQPAFLFGDALAAAGKQFLNGVDNAIGIEIAVWTERGTLPVYEAFLAPSDKADHLIEVERDANGLALGRYQALSQRQLYARQIGMLSAALHPDAVGIALARGVAKPAPEPEQPGQSAAAAPLRKQPAAEVICPACGNPNPEGQKFCGHCGTRLIAQENLSPPLPPADAATAEPKMPQAAQESRPSAPPQGPKLSVRQWFRTLAFSPGVRFELRRHPADAQRVMAVERPGRRPEEVPMTREQAENLARLLRRMREQRLASEDAFKALHAALRLRDSLGTVWTVGLGSLRWNRMEQGKWIAADEPPDMVWLGMDVLQQLIAKMPSAAGQRLIHAAADRPERVPTSTPSARPIALPIADSCPVCGTSLRPGAKFCPNCGTRFGATASKPTATSAANDAQALCPACGKPLHAGAKFCNACGAPVAETPKPAQAGILSFELPEQTFHTMLSRVHYARASKESGARDVMNGLLIVVESNELRLVATDGHRLAIAGHPVLANTVAAHECILRPDTVDELMASLTERDTPVTIDMASAQVRFRFGGKIVQADLFERIFPDVRRIIPAKQPNVLRIARRALAQALQRIGGEQQEAAVAWSLDRNQLTLEAKDGSAIRQSLAADYRGNPLLVAFNSRYWLDALQNLDCEAVEIGFDSALSPAALTIPGTPDFKYVVMPIRA